MIFKKIYFYIYAVALILFYLLCYFIIPDMDEIFYISLMFLTISTSLICFLPLNFAQAGKSKWMGIKMLFVLVPYLLFVIICSYLFCFKFTINISFYFLMHIIVFAVMLFILFGVSKIVNKDEKKEEVATNGNIPQ